jgi:hypothetical protein
LDPPAIFAHGEEFARADSARRLQQNFPRVFRFFLKQKEFNAASGLPFSKEPRGEHFRVIQNQHIAGPKIIKRVGEAPMRDRFFSTLINKKPCVCALWMRRLRD